MDALENEQLLRRYIAEVWDAADPAAVRRFLDPAYRRHLSPGTTIDLDGQVERLMGFRSAFPDVTITVEDVVSADDRVVFRSTMRGTHLGEVLGIAPTGRSVGVILIDILRVSDGRFVEQWGGPDLYDLVRQLGGTVTVGA